MRVRAEKHGVHGETRETTLAVRFARRFFRFGEVGVQLVDGVLEHGPFDLKKDNGDYSDCTSGQETC